MTSELPVEIPANISLWFRDPAKIAFRVVSIALILAGAVTAAIAQWADLIPDKYKATVQVVAGIATAVTVGGAKIQSFLTANGYGPKKNGKNGAYAPTTVNELVGHAQTMSVRKQGHSGEDLPGAPAAAPAPVNPEVETFGVVL